jgi:hypothetical protein
MKKSLTGKTIELREDVTYTCSHEVLQELFAQLLGRMSQDEAFALVAAYLAGKSIEFQMALNSRGKEYLTAARIGIGEDWRLTETEGSA